MIAYISKYRAQLMAFAIMGILLAHTANDYGWFPINRLIRLGYGGVDVFFFLSGFGLYFSYSKDSRPLPFYVKRFVRVYPAFFVVMLLWFWKYHIWEWNYCLKIASTLGFWFPTGCGWHYMAWFVSAIFLLYLIFPPYFTLFRRSPLGATLGAGALGLALGAVYTYTFTYVYPGAYNGYILFLTRIPVFFMGTYFGHLATRYSSGVLPHARFWQGTMWVCLIVGFVGINLLFDHCSYMELRLNGLLFYPFILMVPGACAGCGWLLSHIPKWGNKLLALVGGSTLEAYLLMAIFFGWKTKFVALCGGNGTLGSLLMVAVTLLAAYALHVLLAPAIKWVLRVTGVSAPVPSEK